MKNKTITKSILSAFVIFVSLFLFTIAISALEDPSAGAGGGGFNCDDIQEEIERYQELFEPCNSYWSVGCQVIAEDIAYYQDLYQENCVEEEPEPEPCVTIFDSEKMNYQYKVDNSPYYVTKVYIEATGEIAFCIEPDAMMKDCHDDYYTVSADDLTAEELVRISLAAMFYFEEPSNTHYVAAQMYIWKVIGFERTVNGHDISYYWSDLEQMIEDALNGSLSDVELETSIVETESVEIEFQYSNIMVDLNSTFTNVDVNGNLTNEYFTLTISPTGPDGQGDNM